MPRGGFREETLKNRRWKSYKTTTARFPEELIPRLRELATAIHDGKTVTIEGESSIDPLQVIQETVKAVSREAATAKALEIAKASKKGQKHLLELVEFIYQGNSSEK